MCKVRCVKISIADDSPHKHSFAVRMHRPCANIPRGRESDDACSTWNLFSTVTPHAVQDDSSLPADGELF